MFWIQILVWNLNTTDESLFECETTFDLNNSSIVFSEFLTLKTISKLPKTCKTLISRRNQLQHPKPESTYQVEIVSSSERGSGTTAKVYLKLFGANFQASPEVLLDNHPSNFETGRRDVFELKIPDLGNISCIEIRHDNSGSSPDWLLDRIVVTHISSSKQWTFYCPYWFSRRLDDNAISRKLFPTLLPYDEGISLTPSVDFGLTVCLKQFVSIGLW